MGKVADPKEHMTKWGYKERYKTHKGYYVVAATHPDNPNYSGNSRGRKRHLCTTTKKNDKTLCNMLNDGFTYTESLVYGEEMGWWDSWVDNGYCGNCIKQASSVERSNK